MLSGCGPLNNNTNKGFYELYADWDVIYVPIIEPYRASSVDNGEKWAISNTNGPDIRLNRNTSGGFYVKSFGVSRNYIFGQQALGLFMNEEIEQWFILDVNTAIYSHYDTKEEMLGILNKYNAPYAPIYTCNEHFQSLKKEKKCYWFPPKGTSYRLFESYKPASTINIIVEVESNTQVDFDIPKPVKYDPSKVYYFKISINKNPNDLFYVSVDHTPPVLIKNGLIFPVFIDERNIGVSVYTPFPVGKEKGIKEEDRIVISKTFDIY
jgi:hypothetical protein